MIFRRNSLGLLHQLRGWEQLFGGAGGEVQAHFRAGDHKGIAHVVAGVSHIGKANSLEMAEFLLNGQQVRQHLGGMELVGQTVPDGDSGIFSQLLHRLLLEAAVLNAVKHAAQHPCGVGDALLFAHLGAAGVQICHTHSQVVARHLKGAAGAGGGLLKQQHNVLVFQVAVGNAVPLHPLKLLGQIQQITDFRRGVI